MLKETATKAFRNRWAGKLLLLALAIIGTGLPVLNLWQAVFLFCFAVYLYTSKLVLTGRKPLILFTLYLVLFMVKWGIPLTSIQEGHNIFLPPEGERFMDYPFLPSQIKTFMAGQFNELYGDTRTCDPKVYGCWRYFGRKGTTFAFSADSFWQRPLYSRTVDRVDFTGLSSFRGGFANDSSYNWYIHYRRPPDDFSPPPREVTRDAMPFFVMYALPSSLKGATLCWQGDIFVTKNGSLYEYMPARQYQCMVIDAALAGKKLWGVSIGTPLAMKLALPKKLGNAASIRTMLEVSLVLVLCLFLRPCIRRNIALYTFTSLGVLVIVMLVFSYGARHGVEYRLFENDIIMNGGDDGLTYKGWAKEMLQALGQGRILDALQGGEGVFYYTPGYRYFRVLNYLLFGETDIGIALTLLFLLIAVGLLVSSYMGFPAALAVLVLFCFIASINELPILWRMTSHWEFNIYYNLAYFGFGETLSYAFFYYGLYLMKRFLSTNAVVYGWRGSLAFVFAGTIRPLLFIGIGFILLVAYGKLLKERRYGNLAAMMTGFLPVFLCSLHNVYFGGKFFFLTNSAAMAHHLTIPPERYLAGISSLACALATGTCTMQPWQDLVAALTVGWLDYYLYRVLFIVLWCCLFFVLRFADDLKIVALGALGLQLPYFVYRHDPRYEMAAWFLTLFAVLLLAYRWIVYQSKSKRSEADPEKGQLPF